MRLVLDLQGAQSESRVRGIGRYSLSLALAIARKASEHEVLIALNGRLADRIEPIRAAFDDLLPQSHIRVWRAPGPVADVQPGTSAVRDLAERLREAFLASLEPDVVLVSSLFEGFGDDAVTSIGVLAPELPTAVTLYDLVPLTVPHPNPTYREHYERKLQSFRRASLWLGISQYSCDEAMSALGLPQGRVTNISGAAGPQFTRLHMSESAREALMRAYGITRPFVCTVGTSEERKNLDALFQAFARLDPELRAGYQLVLVGHMLDADREAMKSRASACGLRPSEVVFTGHVSDRDLVLLYNACAVFAFPSLYEGFGLPALEAMQCGAPVIAANTSSLPEVIGLEEAMFDPRSVIAQAQALTRVLTDGLFRAHLIDHGLKRAGRFSWDRTAQRALGAMEQHHATVRRNPVFSYSRIIDSVAGVLADAGDDGPMIPTAIAIAHNHPTPRARQLFVDVSELIQHDAGTGVQRVTRSILKELLRTPPQGYSVEPVYATVDGEGYRYARRFAHERFGIGRELLPDRPIDYGHADVFFGLDLQHHVVVRQERFFTELRASGVSVHFLIYDLLPVLLPQYFPPGLPEHHHQWMSVLAGSDGVIGISRDVADQYVRWMESSGIRRFRPLRIGWAHLGSDIDGSLPTMGLPEGAESVLQHLAARPSFLMVGTIEPRKGHAQALDAFEQLWEAGKEVNLVIVGRRGWMLDGIMQRLSDHPRRGTRLFWLEGISDEYLERIYAACTCLIAASEGEGYGLPLVEAARHKMQILARDIPVFREVAGSHASYFGGTDAESLATAVERWLTLRAANRHPRSDAIVCPTWEECVERLKSILTSRVWYTSWPPVTARDGASADPESLALRT